MVARKHLIGGVFRVRIVRTEDAWSSHESGDGRSARLNNFTHTTKVCVEEIDLDNEVVTLRKGLRGHENFRMGTSCTIKEAVKASIEDRETTYKGLRAVLGGDSNLLKYAEDDIESWSSKVHFYGADYAKENRDPQNAGCFFFRVHCGMKKSLYRFDGKMDIGATRRDGVAATFSDDDVAPICADKLLETPEFLEWITSLEVDYIQPFGEVDVVPSATKKAKGTGFEEATQSPFAGLSNLLG